jgi:hypothetical protein
MESGNGVQIMCYEGEALSCLASGSSWNKTFIETDILRLEVV